MPDSSENTNARYVKAEVIQPENNTYDNNKKYGENYYRSKSVNSSYAQFYTIDRRSCLTFSITFAIFFVCLVRFGVLAGIGFLVFNLICSIMNGIHAARQLMQGHLVNPWTWRTVGWILSFLLTAWLAGGLK